MAQHPQLNDKRITNAWCMYDWSISVYSLTIVTAIFPIYYESITTVDGNTDVDFFGWILPNTALYSYALSFSFLFTAFILPLLTGIADYSGKKKLFLKAFAYLGALACAGLFFFEDAEGIEYGMLMVVLASIGYSGSLVFYDAYLPEIATPDRYDRLSARGYSYGYVGSVLLLILNLLVIEMPEMFGLEDGALPAQISFITVALWWIGFSQIPFKRLPANVYNRQVKGKYFSKGYKEIRKVYRSLRGLPNLKRYLLAFLFYNAGVQAVMYLATLFGTKELEMEKGALIMTVLIIQIVAIGGAYVFARVSEKRGNVFSISVMIIIWIIVCIAAYFVNSQYQFFALAFVVGVVMGGIQSLSRATYSKLIPESTIDHASYFSFYDVTYNVSLVMGTFAYGFVDHLTDSMRNSALALGVFFIIGFVLLRKVKISR